MEHYYDIMHTQKEDDIHVLECNDIPGFYLEGKDIKELKRDIDPVIRKLRGLTEDSYVNWILIY